MAPQPPVFYEQNTDSMTFCIYLNWPTEVAEQANVVLEDIIIFEHPLFVIKGLGGVADAAALLPASQNNAAGSSLVASKN